MRKILLGSTVVLGALLSQSPVTAQEAPTVRIGGFFQAFYGHTQQSNTVANGVNFAQPANVPVGQITPATPGFAIFTPGGVVVVPPTVATAGSTQVSQQALGSARAGKHDFSSDAAIQIFVDGKAANGLTYGAVMDITFDTSEGAGTASGRRSVYSKTTAALQEAFGFIASPTFGQLRFGDDDGPAGGLMNTGVITAAGTGGVYGYWQNFVIRPNRGTTAPGALGDNTKVVYLSPQVAGFDFGASFAFNTGTGQDTGCTQSFTTYSCDRTYASTGASRAESYDRRNEHQVMLRWRGEVAGVGIATSVGHVGWTPISDATVAGTVVRDLRPGNVWLAGAQATAYDFTIGANYQWGQANFGWGSQSRGSQKGMEQLMGGVAYTKGAITVGGNAFMGHYQGSNPTTFNTTTGSLTSNCTDAAADGACVTQRRYGYSVGANYRIAQGLDFIVEYTRHVVHKPGANVTSALSGSNQDQMRADVVLIGTRLAF